MKHLYNLIEKIDQELESVSKKTEQSNSPLSSSELQRIDLLSHTLKSLECVCQIREGAEDNYSGRSRRYYGDDDYSGRRMRSARTGRLYSGESGENSMNHAMGNSMDSNSMGGNSMNANRSYDSYGGNQNMAQKLREMANMMEQQNQG